MPDKAARRSQLLAARSALPAAERAAAQTAITEHLLTLPEVEQARAVLGYAAFGSEASVDTVLQVLLDRAVGVLLPWVDGHELRLARVRDLAADLAPGWRGVREPRGSSRRPARADRVHLALVPGVGFDRAGRRLGYGGGHFDRLLATLRPATPIVGVAFDLQVVDVLPAEPHDVRVDAVVTETGIHRTGA